MKKIILKSPIFCFLGNILEHYDSALFGLLAPLFSQLFFGSLDPLVSLILTYAILPLGLISRPLGAIVFGKIAERFGRKLTLIISLLGSGCLSLLIGFLPAYDAIGWLAPIFLAIARLLLSFFASVESVGAALMVLEKTKQEKRTITSGFFDASSVAGMMIATLLIVCLQSFELLDKYWRALFFIGALPAFFALMIRLNFDESEEYKQDTSSVTSSSIFIKKEPLVFISIIIASGFSYMTYFLSFNLIPSLLPLVAKISYPEVMKFNILLLLLDIVLLPLFGYLAARLGKTLIMMTASCLLAIISPICFLNLGSSSMAFVIFFRIIVMMIGVAFSSSYFVWAIDKVNPKNRLAIISLAQSIGSQLIGAPTSAISLFSFKYFNHPAALSIYVCFIALLSFVCIFKIAMKQTGKKLAL